MLIVYSPVHSAEEPRHQRNRLSGTSTPPSASSTRLRHSSLAPSASAAPSTYSPPSLSLLCCPGAVTCLKTPKGTLQSNLTACCSVRMCVCVCVRACTCVHETEIIACVYSEACHYTAASLQTPGWMISSFFAHVGINSVSRKKKKHNVLRSTFFFLPV